MPRPEFIELGWGRDITRIPILYEDRSILAIDKPAGWLLVPLSWQKTQRNLQAAIISSVAGGDFWSKSRNLKFLRHVHRLDGDTTGILLFAKSPGALDTFSDLFESRQMDKTYLAVVHGAPKQTTWTCQSPLAPDPKQIGRVHVDRQNGKPAETAFRLVTQVGNRSLIEAQPVTGRTHQIRVHLFEAGLPVVGDDLYGPAAERPSRSAGKKNMPAFPLALRAVGLDYVDPFRRQPVKIRASSAEFLRAFGFPALAFA